MKVTIMQTHSHIKTMHVFFPHARTHFQWLRVLGKNCVVQGLHMEFFLNVIWLKSFSCPFNCLFKWNCFRTAFCVCAQKKKRFLSLSLCKCHKNHSRGLNSIGNPLHLIGVGLAELVNWKRVSIAHGHICGIFWRMSVLIVIPTWNDEPNDEARINIANYCIP